MRAIREIGLARTFKYGFFTCAQAVYELLLFSPLRVACLRLFGARVGKETVVERVRFFNMDRQGFSGLRIGRACFLGDECLIDLAARVTLEEQATLAQRVTILTHTNVGYKDHPLQPFVPSMTGPVVIRRGAFIGANATLLPGVEIGKCAVVAAGAVVLKNVPPFTVVGGVPAKPLKSLGDPSPLQELAVRR